MRRNNRIGIYITGVTVLLLMLIPLVCLASPQPRWLREHMAGTFELPGLYYGVASAPYEGESPTYGEKDLARDRAVNDLSYRLSVSVQSSFKERLAQRGSFSDQEVESSLFVTTRLVLSGVEPQEDWTDRKNRLYWLIVTVDRQEADKQVAQQNFITEVIDRLEGKQDEVLKGIKTIEEVLSQRLTAYEGQVAHLTGLIETIDSKIEHAGAQTRQEYASLQTEIEHLEHAFIDSQNAKMDELIHQNHVLHELLGKISQTIGGDYFLALSADDLKYQQANPQFRVRIEPEKGQGADYYHGEKVRFQVRASRDCYIKVIYLSSTAEGAGSRRRMNILLFPNTHDRDNRIRAGEPTVIGRHGELEIRPPYGRDVITVVASERQFKDLKETLQSAEGAYYAEVTANTRGAIRMRSRGIELVEPASSTLGSGQLPNSLNSVATDTCFIVSHPK
jgi:hypothetical protein